MLLLAKLSARFTAGCGKHKQRELDLQEPEVLPRKSDLAPTADFCPNAHDIASTEF